MKRQTILLSLLLFFAPLADAAWSPQLNISRVEINASGIFLVTTLSGLTESGCTPSTTYTYVQFSSADEKLADRAMATTYYAQSTGKKIRAFIASCTPTYAVANSIWVE